MGSERGMRVRTKLLLVLAVPFAVCAGLVAVFLVSRAISDRGYQEALAWSEHATAVLELDAAVHEYVDAVDRGAAADELAAQRATLATVRDRSLALAAAFSPRELAEEREVSAAVSELLAHGAGETRAIHEIYRADVLPRIGERVADEKAGSHATAKAGRKRSDRVLVIAVIAAALLLAFGLAIAMWFARGMARSLAYLSNETQRLASGDLSGAVELRSHDELGQLARSFNAMALALRSTMINKSELEVLVQQRTAALGDANVELAASDQRHRVLFDLSPVPMCVFDGETGAFVTLNTCALALFGYTREELLALTIHDLAPTFDLRAQQRAGDAIVACGVLLHRAKDGRWLDIDTRSHAITVDGRRRVLAIGVDVTAARKLEDQLRQAQKLEAVGRLAGGIAHDFNNILAAIVGSGELIGDALEPDHPARADVTELLAAAQRAAGLTRQMLAFGRKQASQPRALAVNEVVANLEKMLGRIVGEDLAITLELAPELGTVRADVGQLEQALTNLVVNSRDAMPDGGTITIATSNVDIDHARGCELGLQVGRYVAIAVTDTGCGMDELTKLRVFEPFFTTKDVGKGTGLGLAMVFGIVKQHDGAIELASELGRGTTFRIFLPRVDQAPDVAAVTAAARPRGGSETVLLVEDDPQVRTTILRLLDRLGYRALHACDGASALELVDTTTEQIDLLLTDLVMPGIDGRALATEIGRRRPGTTVLFMSGYSEHAKLEPASRAPHEHFIAKPFASAAFASALREALASRAARGGVTRAAAG